MGRFSAPWLITASLLVILLVIAGYAIYIAARPAPAPMVRSGEFVVRVDARRAGWQAVGIAVERGAALHISVVGGQWTHNRGEASLNAGTGGDYVCAEVIPASSCIEPVPEFAQGGLIGRIGARTIAVGEEVSVVAAGDGPVSLRINDADEGLYDNDGVLTVRVVVGQ